MGQSLFPNVGETVWARRGGVVVQVVIRGIYHDRFPSPKFHYEVQIVGDPRKELYNLPPDFVSREKEQLQ